MTVQEIHNFCETLDGVYNDFPFDFKTLVFRHCHNKRIFIFFINHFSDNDILLKGSPARNLELRETYTAIKAGYHMNKLHWNSVITAEVDDELLKAMILESYNLTR